MRKQIRRGVFETNSSSTHSICIAKNAELIFPKDISFDNLAIEQLNVKRLFTTEGWETFYMGDDFTFTMYIDAVKQEYAPTSRSTERTSFKDFTLIQYFSNHK